ncbi:MAG: alkaline phosphatase family protein, partial [Clostridia bacterium]|nr:alkaline phosphatase family protein [Clostridia bacterium]
SLTHACFYAGRRLGYKEAGEKLTDELIRYLKEYDTDFSFLYFGHTDMEGHRYGWMGKEYMQAIQDCWDNVEKIIAELGDDYTYIITADHSGHDRTHGTDMPEDMLIPVIIRGKDFEAGSELGEISILDIAPTIAKLAGLNPDSEWEGTALI